MNDVAEILLIHHIHKVHTLWAQGRYEEADIEAIHTPPGYETVVTNPTDSFFCVTVRPRTLQLPPHVDGQTLRTTQT